MAKPWAKTEIDFINHPKFRSLSANAICLWIEGKNYCDKHMTDGLIPAHEAKQFRFAGKASVDALMRSAGPKNETESYQPLWSGHPVGFKMVGYLEYNPCREEALARIEQAEKDKQADRDRKAKARAVKKTIRETRPENVRPEVRLEVRPVSVERPEEVRLYTEAVTKEVSKEQKPPHPISRFLGLYEDLFEKAHGSKPVIVEGRDAAIAKRLITKQGEEPARALLRAFFESDDPFIQQAGHGLNVFAGQVNKLLSSRKLPKPQADVPEPDWMADYCFHKPCCESTEDCRAKRSTEPHSHAAPAN